MKNKLVVLLILAISLSLIGCATKEKVDEVINPPKQTSENTDSGSSETIETEPVTEVSNDIKEQAEKEGVSVKELQVTLDGLAQLSAEKYGMTKEEYIDETEARGDTILSEWQLASENMGMSITEIYQYEKQRGDTLTDEQKETMTGMNDALKMAEKELENMPEMGTTDVENMLGIYGNESGEIRVVTISDEELKDTLLYGVYKMTQDYEDEYSLGYDYVSDADITDIVSYFEELVIGTEGYMKLQPTGMEGAMFQGMINETSVYIEIDNSQGGMSVVATYFDLTSKK